MAMSHGDITNGFIDYANDHLQDCEPSVIASAILCAAATFASFSFQAEYEEPLDDSGIEVIVEYVRRRLMDLKGKDLVGRF